MKKISVSLIVLLLTLFVCIGSVSATEITSTEYKNEQIQIKGKGEGQVQIVLFDSKNLPMYMTTANATNGEFSITLPKIENLTEGSYKVKIADYNGENVKEEKVEVVKQDIDNTKDDVPKTGNNIIFYIILFSISVLGIITTIILKKKQII